MSTTVTLPATASTVQIKPFEWILNNRYRWVFHGFFWILMYLDEFLALIGITPALNYPREMFFVFLGDILMVYINLYFLIPKYLLKNRLVSYLLLILLTVALNMLMVQFMFYYPEGYDDISPLVVIISDSVGTITLLGTAIGIKLFKFLLHEKQRRQEAEKMSLETEIAYLKDQINPHFLFNSLNNLYVQIRKRPHEAAESVLLLSDLLRYQLYDSAKEQVYLNGEIDYLKNYLELDKMRRSHLEVDFTVEGTPNGKMVAPYLFLPFVENAIKHGAGVEDKEFIRVEFVIEAEQINFKVINSKPERPTNHLAGGIGLNNVKRRLELLYPSSHELKIQDTEKEYQIELIIQL
ncbi:MAG: sensor histidine kinase [Saprospiraceae bacterium]